MDIPDGQINLRNTWNCNKCFKSSGQRESREQSVPQDTLFRDDLFEEASESVRARNEAMVVRDISPLICPSAQVLRIHGAKHLKPLIESVNEGWEAIAFDWNPFERPTMSMRKREVGVACILVIGSAYICKCLISPDVVQPGATWTPPPNSKLLVFLPYSCSTSQFVPPILTLEDSYFTCIYPRRGPLLA